VVLGTTLIGGAVAAWYRLGLPSPDIGAGFALDEVSTLGGAHATAQQLSTDAAVQLLHAANTAFREGVTVTCALSAGFVILFAAYIYWNLRQGR